MEDARQLAEDLRGRIANPRVLAAVASVPRAAFVPQSERARAYENRALPIACGQTISQPLVVARMLELLAPGPEDTVLDVGTGSGYHAALLAQLAGRVVSVERHAQLAEQARRTLDELGVANVEVLTGDGAEGLPGRAPFPAINVAAAVQGEVPAALVEQLMPGGRLVAPVGSARQRLVVIRRTAQGLERSELEGVRFVPLVPGPAPTPPR